MLFPLLEFSVFGCILFVFGKFLLCFEISGMHFLPTAPTKPLRFNHLSNCLPSVMGLLAIKVPCNAMLLQQQTLSVLTNQQSGSQIHLHIKVYKQMVWEQIISTGLLHDFLSRVPPTALALYQCCMQRSSVSDSVKSLLFEMFWTA